MRLYQRIHLQMMIDIGHGYEAARAQRKAEKEALMKADDWDGVKVWNEREKQFLFPFSAGYMKAYRAWQESRDNQSSIFEVQDLPRAKDAHDFIACLNEAGKMPSGYWQQVSQVSIAQTYLKIMNKFAEQFGLIPASRSRIIAGNLEGNGPVDEMEALLGGDS